MFKDIKIFVLISRISISEAKKFFTLTFHALGRLSVLINELC